MATEAAKENIISFASYKKAKDQKKNDERLTQDAERARTFNSQESKLSRNRKLEIAMAKHGSDRGAAIRNRWKGMKIDLDKPQEEKE